MELSEIGDLESYIKKIKKLKGNFKEKEILKALFHITHGFFLIKLFNYYIIII